MRTATRLTRTLAIATAFVASATVASAQQWTATLSGPAEAPVNNSPGIGSAIFTLTGNNLRIQITFSGLIGNTTASHIHCCTAVPGTATAGVTTQLPSFAGFPLGVTSGTFDNIYDLTNAASYNPAFVTASANSVATARERLITGMNGGNAYLNIHSSAFPGGEIRGFIISTVPEPSSVLLMGTGMLGLIGVAARRRNGAR